MNWWGPLFPILRAVLVGLFVAGVLVGIAIAAILLSLPACAAPDTNCQTPPPTHEADP